MVKRNNNGSEKVNSYNLRIFLLLGLITAFIVLIIFRLFNLQVIDHDLYLAQAAQQRGQNNVIPAQRGEIYFSSTSNNQPVLAATNITMQTVFAIGKEMNADDLKFALAFALRSVRLARHRRALTEETRYRIAGEPWTILFGTSAGRN